MAKPQLKKITTLKGIAAYAWLNKPDDKFDKDNPKYKLSLIVDKDDPNWSKFADKVEALGRASAKEQDVKLKKKVGLPWDDGDEKEDENGNPDEQYANKWIIKASSGYKPGQCDSDGEPLEDGVWVSSGDEVKFSAQLYPYEGFGGGISLRLRNVMLLTKNSGAGNPGDDFGDDDYEYDEESGDDDDDDF